MSNMYIFVLKPHLLASWGRVLFYPHNHVVLGYEVVGLKNSRFVLDTILGFHHCIFYCFLDGIALVRTQSI